jgi:hypothetical protein
MQRVLQCADSAVDMLIRPGLEPLGISIVLFMTDILAGLAQVVQCGMQATGLVGNFVYRGMIVDVLAIPDGSTLDLVDGGIDPMNGCLLIHRLGPITGAMLDHPACGAEV